MNGKDTQKKSHTNILCDFLSGKSDSHWVKKLIRYGNFGYKQRKIKKCLVSAEV